MENEKVVDKTFKISDLPNEIQSLYYSAKVEYQGIIANIFNEKNVGVEINDSDRPLPPYAKGSLDKPLMEGGMPLQSKPRDLVKAIISGNYRFIEIEGGVRGSKDIWGLFGWFKYLMNCPDKVHLALGSSLEHVLRTVLMSDGFGLYFLIPHGIFVRESISGAQRGVYKFLDNYGLEKQILFYGNEKENDSNKFQGFTIGSVYANETLNHHVKGLIEANNRMASVRQPLMIMTQNPRGEASPYYTDFERPKLALESDIVRMEYVRDELEIPNGDNGEMIKVSEAFKEVEKKLLKDRDDEKRKIIRSYFKRYSVTKISELPTNLQLKINEKMININYEFDKIIRSYGIEDFAPYYIFDRLDYDDYVIRKQRIIDENKGIKDQVDIDDMLKKHKIAFYERYKDEYLLQKELKKILNFERGRENKNNILNSYDFYYAHFTVDDNLAMTEMQRNNFKNTFIKGTSSYDQSVLGLRRTAEGAVYDAFSTQYYDPENPLKGGNIFNTPLDEFDWTGLVRAIVIDPGFSHPTGITDWAVDLNRGIAYCIQERMIDFKIEYIGNKSNGVIYNEFLKIVRGAKNRADPDYVIIDPSKPELIDYIQNYGFSVYPASNENWTTRGRERENSNEVTNRDLRGIPLVQTGFAKRKFLIHENCPLLIKQIGSYAYEDNKKGQDELPKLYDDLVVTVKYMANTLNIAPSLWIYDESENDKNGENEETEDDKIRMGRIQSGKDSEGDLETQIRFTIEQAFKQRIEGNQQEEENDFFGNQDEFDFFN